MCAVNPLYVRSGGPMDLSMEMYVSISPLSGLGYLSVRYIKTEATQ